MPPDERFLTYSSCLPACMCECLHIGERLRELKYAIPARRTCFFGLREMFRICVLQTGGVWEGEEEFLSRHNSLPRMSICSQDHKGTHGERKEELQGEQGTHRKGSVNRKRGKITDHVVIKACGCTLTGIEQHGSSGSKSSHDVHERLRSRKPQMSCTIRRL